MKNNGHCKARNSLPVGAMSEDGDLERALAYGDIMGDFSRFNVARSREDVREAKQRADSCLKGAENEVKVLAAMSGRL